MKELRACKVAALQLRAASTDAKNRALGTLARLLDERRAEVLEANLGDLQKLPEEKTLSKAFKERMTLTDHRIDGIVESLRAVARLPDPVNEEVERRTLRNGLLVRRVRAPLGVILMIFESRPNVAVEAFSLALKSGNVVILRGGKETMGTTAKIYELAREALSEAGLPADALWGITNPDRALTLELLQQRALIDVVVPRGGDSLIEFVVANSKIPIIKNDRGMCHVYVHHDADEELALAIVDNAKTQRPGVCNSMETVLVHEKLAPKLLPMLWELLSSGFRKGSEGEVEWRGDPRTLEILKGKARVAAADAKSFDTEYLDFVMNCRVVSSLEEAIAHIERHGSRHSEAIVTTDEKAARLFQSEVDAAAVYWNASTRFTDGFELGLGGELGISTQKLHVRGPVGLRELTSVRWIIDGTGQTRE